MKKRLIAFCLSIAVIFLSLGFTGISVSAGELPKVWDGTVAKGFARGNGTYDDPYVIETPEQLAYLADTVNSQEDEFEGKYIVLANDIVLNDTSDWESWNSDTAPKNIWEPIGNSLWGFCGNFNGLGHVIRGAYVYKRGTDRAGIFEDLTNAVIKNLGVEKSYFESTNGFVGAIAAYSSHNTNIIGCYNTSTVKGYRKTGGIIGCGSNTHIENCYNKGYIKGEGETGGIVGDCSGTISNCYNTGKIIAGYSTWDKKYIGGGIVGYFDTITNSEYADNKGVIKNCYNTGYVIGCYSEKIDSKMAGIGGIIGCINYKYAFISNCYNYSLVMGGYTVGGIIGGLYVITCKTEECYYLRGRVYNTIGVTQNGTGPNEKEQEDRNGVVPLDSDQMLYKIKQFGFNENGDRDGYLCELCFSHIIDSKIIKETTCVTEGKKLYYCTNKDCTFSYTEVIPIHKYETVTDESGNIVKICSLCQSKPVSRVDGVSVSQKGQGLTVSWNKYTDADRYFVYMLDADLNTLKAKSVSASETSCDFSKSDGVKYGEKYYFRVIAKLDTANYLNAELADNIVACIEEISCVSGVSVSTDDSRLNVSWESYPNATEYYVYVYQNDNLVIVRNAGTNTSVSIIDKLKEEIDYTVKVIAKVDGSYMSRDNATAVKGRIAAKSPDEITVVATTPKQIKIKWKEVNFANEYYVRITDENGNKRVVKSTSPTAIIGNLDAGKTYSVAINVQLKYLNSSGSYSYRTLTYGAENTVQTGVFDEILLSAQVENNSVKLSWNATDNAHFYYVYEKVDGKWIAFTTIKDASVNYYNIEDAKSGEHTYSIIAKLKYDFGYIYTDRIVLENVIV